MHESLHISLGTSANHLSTHFFNTQESYFTYPPAPPSCIDHDVLFRPGLSPTGVETFTPRTVIYDVREAFGALRRDGGGEGGLYEGVILEESGEQEGMEVWNSQASASLIQRAPPISPSPYHTALNAGLPPPPLSSSGIRYWTDYTRLFYHPRSLIALAPNQPTLSTFRTPGTTHGTSSSSPTALGDAQATREPNQLLDGTFASGLDLFRERDTADDVLDRDVRPWIEECDALQGLQVVAGADSAWGGYASGLVERMRDEYARTPVWVWGLSEAGRVPLEIARRRRTNVAYAVHTFATHASLYIPLYFEEHPRVSYLNLNMDSPWHIGAIKTAAMESMTIPTRLRQDQTDRTTLGDLEQVLNSGGQRRIAQLEMDVADPSKLQDAHPVVNGTGDVRMLNGVNSDDDDDDEKFERFEINFMPPDPRLGGGRVTRRRHRILARVESLRGGWKRQDSDQERRNPFGGPVIERHHTNQLFPLSDTSYPRVFEMEGRPEALAIRTALSTSTSVADYVKGLEMAARRLVPVEEREYLCDGLQTLASEYEEGWASGSDEDDDE